MVAGILQRDGMALTFTLAGSRLDMYAHTYMGFGTRTGLGKARDTYISTHEQQSSLCGPYPYVSSEMTNDF